MLYFPKWLVTLILGICAVGVVLSATNLFSPQTLDALPGWIPKKQVSLGLDLRGGSHLLLEVDMNAVRRERFNGLVDSLRTEFRTARIGYTGLNGEGDHISFTLREPERLDDVHAIVKKIDPEIDLTANGPDVTLKPNPVALQSRTRSVVAESLEKMRRRIDETGTKEPIIEREGQDRILVQLPGVENPEHVKDILGHTAKLTLRFVDQNVSPEDAKAGHLPPGDELLPLQDGRSGQGASIVVQKRVMVSGDTLTDAQATFDQNGAPVVAFTFDSTGTRRFAEATRANVGKLFAIVLDNKVISAPVIREPITQGHGQI